MLYTSTVTFPFLVNSRERRFLGDPVSSPRSPVSRGFSPPPPAAPAAGGWGNPGSRPVYSVGLVRVPADGVMEVVVLAVRSVVSACFPSCDGVLRDLVVARATSGGRGSADSSACIVSVRGPCAGGGDHALEFWSPGSRSATTRLAPSSPWNLGVLLCRWSDSGSSSLSPAGERIDLVVPRSPSSPSCWYEETESDDFPSAWISPETSLLAPGGSGGGDAAARPCSASEVAGGGFSKDPSVFFGFFGGVLFCRV
jgi:hypothetical protein